MVYMKKKFILVLLLSLTCLTGCVEYKATMDIKNDKSMIFAIDYAIDTSVFGEEEIMDESDKSHLEEQDFKVEHYEHDNMKGFHITKNIKNIDDFSSTNDTKYNLSGIMNEENKDTKIFKVKKGFFKNTYYADFEFDASDSGLSDNEAEEPIDDEDAIGEEEFNNITSTLMNNLELSFNVNLPNKAINHNAKENEDDKKLKWNLSSNSVDSITFSFELYNVVNIVICAIIAIILLIGIILFIRKKISLKKDNSNSMLSNNVKED